MTGDPSGVSVALDPSTEVASLTVHVVGVPVPQGSMKAISVGGRARLFADNAPALKAWRKQLVVAAQAAMRSSSWTPMAMGPVCVDMTFWVSRPPSVRRVWPCVRPDLDKHVRAVLDALSGQRSHGAGVFADDGQVCKLTAVKRYTPAGHRSGLVVVVCPLVSGGSGQKEQQQ